MDTIELGLDAQDCPIELISRLHELKRTHPDQVYYFTKTNQIYQSSGHFHDDKIFFGIHWDRRFKNMPMFKIQFHFSNFVSFFDFLVWLENMISIGSIEELLDARIMRLDFCCDLALPYDLITRSLRQRRARVKSEFSSSSRTTYIGKGDRVTRIYEKPIEFSNFDFVPESLRDKISDGRTVGTRVESQLRSGYIPIQTLRDVYRLRTFSPYQHLDFVETGALKSNTPTRIKERLMAWKLRAMEVGQQQAMREFNEDGRLPQLIAEFVLRVQNNPLVPGWHNRLNRFLKGIPDEPITRALIVKIRGSHGPREQ